MKKNSVLFLPILTAIFSGCYYDNVEEINLLSSDRACYDTSAALALNYNTNVKWIIEGSCGTSGSQGNSCHGSNTTASFPLTTYTEIKNSINNPTITFLLNIKQSPGANSPMPKGGGKLSDCQIKVIENWINQGMPEN
jgi:hypothetical protein